ncbi:MAG: hypothetical protein ACRBEQ_11630 [Hyphomonas sp.]
MLTDIVAHIARANGLEETTAKQALGIILNAADRQGSPLATQMFKALPGARALAARTGSELGAATGEIARLIERTPGGRRIVRNSMFRALQQAGLDNQAIGELMPTIGTYMEDVYSIPSLGHLGDLLGMDPESVVETSSSVEAA